MSDIFSAARTDSGRGGEQSHLHRHLRPRNVAQDPGGGVSLLHQQRIQPFRRSHRHLEVSQLAS